MPRSADRHALDAAIRSAVATAAAGGRTAVILIDGPSGAGKSSLADALVAAWPAEGRPRIVRMDDLYPGWSGLDAGSASIVDDLLGPLRATGSGRWRRWDWLEDGPGAWETVDAGEPLLVEGCGSLSRGSALLADLAVWLEADDVLRKDRALTRDGAVFAAHWDEWQAEFDRFVAREQPREQADIVVDATAWPLVAAPVLRHGD